MSANMNTDAKKIGCRRKPLAAAIGIALLTPGVALSEPLFQVPLYGNDADLTRWSTNYVEFGGGYNDVTGDSYKFGQYTGLYKSTGFGIANFNWAKGDNASGSYTNLWGLNLGLPSRQIGGGLGTQGRWNLDAQFDQITNYQTNTTSFIFDGLGTGNLMLRPGFTGITAGSQQPPANAAAILPFEQNFAIKTDRDFFTVKGGFTLGNGWDLTASYNYQNRNGTKLTGAAFGNSGGNPRAVLVPYPIDDNTNQFEAALTQFPGQEVVVVQCIGKDHITRLESAVHGPQERGLAGALAFVRGDGQVVTSSGCQGQQHGDPGQREAQPRLLGRRLRIRRLVLGGVRHGDVGTIGDEHIPAVPLPLFPRTGL